MRARAARLARRADRGARGRARDERCAHRSAGRADRRAREALAQLEARLAQNSSNSHLPPSSDSPEERRRRRNKAKKEKQQRKRGGQQGHAGAHRELLSPEKVTKFVDLFPAECGSCWKPLPRVPDKSAMRHQQTELPPIEPHTTEWRRHQVTCPCCGFKTRAAYDATVIPSSPFGPRLMAIMALITGVYNLGRRKAVDMLADVVGVRFSLGALSAVEARVSDAVSPASIRPGSAFATPGSNTPTARAGARRA